MKKKLLYIFISAFLIAGILLVLFALLSRRKPEESVPVIPIITLVPTRTLPSVSSDGSLIIRGVRVFDFTKSVDTVLPNGHMIVENAAAFQIFYYPESQSFLLSILGQPFETAREQAEQELLRKLDVSRDDVCRLNVSITTPSHANPDNAGKIYKMHVCSSE